MLRDVVAVDDVEAHGGDGGVQAGAGVLVGAVVAAVAQDHAAVRQRVREDARVDFDVGEDAHPALAKALCHELLHPQPKDLALRRHEQRELVPALAVVVIEEAGQLQGRVVRRVAGAEALGLGSAAQDALDVDAHAGHGHQPEDAQRAVATPDVGLAVDDGAPAVPPRHLLELAARVGDGDEAAPRPVRTQVGADIAPRHMRQHGGLEGRAALGADDVERARRV